MIINTLKKASGTALCVCLLASASIAQKNNSGMSTTSGLSIKKEATTLNNNREVLESSSVTDEDLAAVWEVVESQDRQIKNEKVLATKLDCQKLTAEVNQAKDIVVSAKPQLRQDLLLSFFEKKKGVAVCTRPSGTTMLDKAEDQARLKQCFIDYKNWPNDPLLKAMPDYVVLSDLDAFTAYWISAHPGEESRCQKTDKWLTTPRQELTTSPR